MTQFQRIVKLCATVLAVVLAVSIIGGIVKAVVGISFAVDLFAKDPADKTVSSAELITAFDEHTVTALEIDLATAELYIEVGKSLEVSHNKSEIRVEQKENTLIIEEEDHLFWDENSIVTLTVPQDFSFTKVDIDTGAGKIRADGLQAHDLSLSIGAGDATFEQLTVTKDADVETGAGKLLIQKGSIERLDLELGVGKAEIVSALGDGSRMECGVGSLELTLLGGADTYTVRAHTGIGRFTVASDMVKESTTVGSGSNTVTVEGGVGSVDVVFA